MKLKSIALIGLIILAACNPFKVTDPSDPKFDPMKFKLQDYSQEEKLQRALDILFPIGTPRSKVESILIDRAGLQAGYTEGKAGNYFVSYIPLVNGKIPSNSENYIYGLGSHQAQFEYDSNDKVASIKSQILHSKRPPKFFSGDLIEMEQKQ